MMKRRGSLGVLLRTAVLTVLAIASTYSPAVMPMSTPALVTLPPGTIVAEAKLTPSSSDAGMLMAPEPNPRRGGILRWGGLANSTLYDLHQTGTIANMGPQAPMYDLLVQVDPVNWNRVIPDLAKSWKISDDGLTYTFYLREGVKFHDGAPLTAEDVVASFDQVIFPPAGVLSPRQGLFEAVKEVVATDALTVEFRLTEPRGYLLRGIAACFAIDPVSEKKAQSIKGLHTAHIFPTAPHGLWLNLNKKPFDNVRVRQAINLVLDKPALSEAIYEVIPIVSAGWLLPTDLLFKEYWAKMKEQPGWRSPTAEDLAEAKRLMKEAGYENGIKGLDFLVRDVTPHIATAPMVQDVVKR